ncbi:alpha/beta fold hydrolase [Metabacillus sp. RGM 3146]|uniref:alpha/beta fold hydrolase n=1 Tax=Metabacillus sp. RGM 3146 TaxID=3401092 RepID=UPI003B9A28BB
MNYYEYTHGDKMIGYIDEGVGDTIVLLHGFCGSHEYFKYLIPLLSEKHRVLAFDLRGHGGTTTTDEPYGVEDMAEDIHEVLKDLKIDHASIFGHSLGGYVTLAFAEKYPKMIASFGLLHSTAFPDTEEGKAKRDAGKEKIEKEGIKPFIDELVPNLFAPQNMEMRTAEIEFVKHLGYHTSKAGATGALFAMKNRPDRNKVIKDAKVPVLLLAGNSDQIAPLQKSFSQEGNHIKQVILEDSGHMGMLEKPEETAKSILEFIENHVNVKADE